MAGDKHIRRSAADYAVAFSNLLPFGMAWPRTTSSVLMKVVKGLAGIWGYVDARAADLLEIETDPRTTTTLLGEWERAFGLPDKCLAEPLTVQARRDALLTRITFLGEQSRQFFIDLAARAGYTIAEIVEYRPFMVGIDRCGDNRTFQDGVYGRYPYIFGPPENRFYWTVLVGATSLRWFRCGSGQCGVDPHLIIALATDLECVLRRSKPAQTEVIFDYSGLAVGGEMAGTP